MAYENAEKDKTERKRRRRRWAGEVILGGHLDGTKGRGIYINT